MSTPHDAPGHVHDAACAAAHGEITLPADRRRLVLVFASPVAQEMAALAGRLGWPVTLVEPDADPDEAAADRSVADRGVADRGVADRGVADRGVAGGSVEVRTSVAAAALDAGCDVVVCDHGRAELGDVLAEALAVPTRWVGVMGSPRHTAPHIAALQERGLSPADIARVHRPIGLDIGSRTPVEIAISTIAGLLADRNGRPGGPFG